MRVFVAGGSGVMGRPLVPQLVPGPQGDGYHDERGQAQLAVAARRSSTGIVTSNRWRHENRVSVERETPLQQAT
jgi:hypothetical protein